MSHAYHDPERLRRGVDATAVVLFDRCERCEEIADRPASELDIDNLRALWAEMLRIERPADRNKIQAYRTINEARACRRLHDIGVFLERIGWGPGAWTMFDVPSVRR